MQSTMSGEQRENISICIGEALGYNGELASVVMDALLANFVDPLKEILANRSFRKIISRKNPYLYRASGVRTINELVDRALSDFTSSSTETLFGNTIDRLARRFPGNITSAAAGVDLAQQTDDEVDLFAIKSGPAGYNSSSMKQQIRDLLTARTVAAQGGHSVNIYIGFAYGRKRTTMRPDGIVVLSSKDFWHKVTGDPRFYRSLVDVLACTVSLYEADLEAARQRMVSEAVAQFSDGDLVDWEAFLGATSG